MNYLNESVKATLHEVEIDDVLHDKIEALANRVFNLIHKEFPEIRKELRNIFGDKSSDGDAELLQIMEKLNEFYEELDGEVQGMVGDYIDTVDFKK